MSDFPHLNNAKLMIAASVRHCRITIEDLPVGQIVVDETLNIRSIDASTAAVLGFENPHGKSITELLDQTDTKFPRKLSPANYGDLGDLLFRSSVETFCKARVVCVPGPHPQTYLLSLVFQLM